MKCEKPFIGVGRVAWPCGQCRSCRTNRRRIWTHRIMLEAMQHEGNCFVTLTYGVDPGSLSPADLQGWLKRLRARVEPRRIRYFCVGEYGDHSGRPHYHAAVFGLFCELGPVVVGPKGERSCRCRTCSAVRDSWGFGHTLVGDLNEKSAAYIAGYVLKKMKGTPASTCAGRIPEFARMSLKPGIGAGAVPDVASVVMQWKLEEKEGDVPSGLRHGKSVMPLGRYLRNRLRLQCGLPEGAPEHVIEALRQGLLPVFDYADAACSAPGMARFKRFYAQKALEEINEQVGANLQARAARRGSL